MPFRVNNDAAALQLERAMPRSNSGVRVGIATDDASGETVAHSFRNDIVNVARSQDVREINDAVSTLQIIDQGLNNITDLLDRARTLAEQAGSDAFTGDRNALQTELDAIVNEIDTQARNIGLGGAEDTEAGRFNNQINVTIASGDDDGSSVQVSIDLRGSRVDRQALGLDNLNVTGTAGSDGASEALAAIRGAQDRVIQVQDNVTTAQTALAQAVKISTAELIQSSFSAVRNAQTATEAANIAGAMTMQQPGVATWAQANQSTQALIGLLG